MIVKALRAISWWLTSKSSYTGRLRYEMLKWKFHSSGHKCSLGKSVRFLGQPQIHLGSTVTIRSYNIIAGRGILKIGDNTVINESGSIACTKYVEIGKNCMLAPRVYILDVDHEFDSISEPIAEQGYKSSPVIIEDDVWIGTQAVVLRGINIGRGAVIGANCVVTHDVPPYAIVGGVPGRVIKTRKQ
jgi:acetyltransferase-like isoleucine patch superfamily enzyme